jgi:carbamoyl-phosphate synthase large subunit
MAIVYDTETLDRYMTHAVDASPDPVSSIGPRGCVRVVDAIADKTGAVIIGGIMEPSRKPVFTGETARASYRRSCPERHLQTTGAHAPHRPRARRRRADERSLRPRTMVYVLEVNPRVAHGPVPVEGRGHVAGARSRPRSWRAARSRSSVSRDLEVAACSSRVPYSLSGSRRGHDPRARDEVHRRVMGGRAIRVAFAKAQLSVGQRLPESGTAFVSVNNHDKANLVPIARDLSTLVSG